MQSALIIGLFSYYCSKLHKCNSLLAVEEPELFLHPHARRMLSNKLDEFVSLDDNYKNQVIITTIVKNLLEILRLKTLL
ncbi:AAA family ATPase [Geobacillus thermoleovorans]|uniref:AAA family ATPase n=1 Tax=Geobacillus thermoleovorans TaxID=33941 RepID=UPI00296E83D9